VGVDIDPRAVIPRGGHAVDDSGLVVGTLAQLTMSDILSTSGDAGVNRHPRCVIAITEGLTASAFTLGSAARPLWP
jgi:hypothetical protein